VASKDWASNSSSSTPSSWDKTTSSKDSPDSLSYLLRHHQGKTGRSPLFFTTFSLNGEDTSVTGMNGRSSERSREQGMRLTAGVLINTSFIALSSRRIALLEGERRSFENVKSDFMRRIKMLEYALRVER
jgi:hypothetical protein